ncbi:MAG: TetR/AcrR family transcriptional regulator [Filifactoraceae bacterium]
MNKSAISKDDILKISRTMILKGGLYSFSMRAIASECNIAVGSIYNYFPSKSDLLGATIESLWEDIFSPFNNIIEFDSFVHCVSVLFETIQSSNNQYSVLFSAHSLYFTSEDREKGREMMHKYFFKLEEKLIGALEKDTNIRENIFQTCLTKKIFISYVFTLIISMQMKNQENYQPLIQLIKTCIY